MSKPNNNTNGTEIVPVEPSENDPCMGNDKQKPNFFLKFQQDACKRWQLTQQVYHFILIVLLLLLLFVIVVVALGAGWPHVPHSQRFPVCRRSECLRAAAQVRDAMNDTISSCSDPWMWACGGWFMKYPLPKDTSVWNMEQQLKKQETYEVRDLITTFNMPLHTASVEWKLKHLYGACLDVDNVNTDEARPLTNIIAELGGWYILRDWNYADFDPNFILKQLQVKYGIAPFFRITVEADPYLPEKNSIRISPSGLGLPEKHYYFKEQDDKIISAYKELIRDVVINLSSTTNEAEKFGNDMFYYEKRIAEITPSVQDLQNPIATCNHITISELKATMLNIPFLDILTAMYPESNVTENTEVIVTSLEYLMQISQIVATTDKKTLNGYLMWTLVRNYLPYLSVSFTSVVDNFNRKLYGVQEPLKRWEVCANLAQYFMSFAINILKEKTDPINNETIQVVNETFTSILNVVKKRLNKFNKIPDLYKHLKRKLFKLQLQIGLPTDLTNKEQYMKNYYTQLRIIKANLFESVKFGIGFKKKLEERLLIKLPQEDVIIKSVELSQITYSPSSNLIIIPRRLLVAPYFETNFPLPVIYGRLGVMIAKAVLSSVLPYENFWTSDGKLLSQYHLTVNDSLKSITKIRQCLGSFLNKLNVDFIIANQTDLVVLKHLSALSVANEALNDFLVNREHIHQATLEEFEDSSLFFLSYAQTQCSQSTPQMDFYRNLVSFELPQKLMLKMAWEQLPQFSEAFDCSFNNKAQCSDLF